MNVSKKKIVKIHQADVEKLFRLHGKFDLSVVYRESQRVNKVVGVHPPRTTVYVPCALFNLHQWMLDLNDLVSTNILS